MHLISPGETTTNLLGNLLEHLPRRPTTCTHAH
jgi:hypothetical protein